MRLSTLNELQSLLPNCLRSDRLRIEATLNSLLERGRAGAAIESQLERLLVQIKHSVALRHRRHEQVPPVSYPPSLPIVARKDEIIRALKAHPVLIIAGETGSGKTTQLPKMCLEAGLGVEGQIGCTQPRRIAALSISRRLASELKVTWGREVGCKIRFADQSRPETHVKFMTDGILLAELQGDPDLNDYDALVIDEAHERSLNIDFLLGHLKTLLARRPELKLVISSATINTEAFAAAFNHAPVIEVSGRLYPVEVRYAPLDPEAEDSGDLTYIDAAVSAAGRVLRESARGDVLIFMPSERDIRETVQDLQGSHGARAEIIPLFGRLTSGEQERVFAPSTRRKIVVATNIAETSLTIPGIRCVIDTGLARISRYNPRTRTKRLPIEPVAQSSARQRAGRCGRLENGVCIRLYSEEDLAARPAYTPPEIQRANLAEVILRMKAFGLGEIETFPFLDPPQPQAIQGGYQLLQELGALDRERHLTPLGRDLARLPVDPSIGRMVLQSVREGVVEEVLVVAAGLSVQDPRERPLDRRAEADQAHRRFLDPRSDFLTLWNIWNVYHDQWDACQTQNQLRKFCRAHFLSYVRMREWRDLQAQLRESLLEVMDLGSPADPATGRPLRDAPPSCGRVGPPGRPRLRMHRVRTLPADSDGTAQTYAGIHRSILAGLLGHIGQRTERNLYRAPGNRQLMVFPGSALFDRREAKGAGGKRAAGRPLPAEPAKSPTQPDWMVAGEVVETARLYARTVAGISPDWIVELGDHLCHRSYNEPHWDRQAGRVLARERVTLFGLTVLEKNTDYGRINPKDATAIFIRSALVEEEIDPPHRFLEHNRQLRQRIEAWRTKSRTARLPDADEALARFYSERLEQVSSVAELNRWLRARLAREPDALCAKESDLTGGQALAWDQGAFPSEVSLAGQTLPLDYAYAPGEEHDGVTVRLPAALARNLRQDMFDWLVPGLREEQIAILLKALPKALRVPLMPLAPKAKELAASLEPEAGLDGLRELIRRKYGVAIPGSAWNRDMLPDYLRLRVNITGQDQQPVLAGRDLNALRQRLETHETAGEREAWSRAVAQWEQYDLAQWPAGPTPERVEVKGAGGAASYAFLGLAREEEAVHLKLFRLREEAERASFRGWVRLAEITLQKDLAWLQKDLKALHQVKELYLTLGPPEELLLTAYGNILNHVVAPFSPLLPLCREAFERCIQNARTRLRGLAPAFLDSVGCILRLRQEVMLCRKPYPGMREDLDRLLPRGFLAAIPFDRLPHLPRYLKAMLVRAERAAVNPAKDRDKARQIQPYLEALARLGQAQSDTSETQAALASFRWMVEEFKVSVFAQELGTAQPVSRQRLDAQWARLASA